jgi:predicted membrane-bound mannosyltransferase/DNA-binding beta-propeller fold protein YncE
MDNSSPQDKKSWLDSSFLSEINLSWEVILFGIILLIAVISRFYDLGARVMSHDETSHVYYAWRLFKGMGYSHDPITHGPFQFHFLTLIYFLLGDSDYTARIPAALTSVATILFLWKYRRYLGSWGTLAAALMFLISPFMLYYGRYVRNESFSALFGVVTIWAILRYLETKSPRFLYWLTAATVLHFTAKETAFIYTAQAMIFLGLVFVLDVLRDDWAKPAYKRIFQIGLLGSVFFLGISLLVSLLTPEFPIPDQEPAGMNPMTAIPLVLALILLLGSLLCSITGYGWKKLKVLPSFSAMLLLGTLVLPQLAPFPAKLLNINPLDYSAWGMFSTGAIILVLTAIAVGIGLAWNPREWLINAAIFYLPFTLLYTTFFTNGTGFFTGLVGSLGYWLDQQAVERGSQPWYYYWLIQIPIYEYLPALGALAAMLGAGAKRLFGSTSPSQEQKVSIPAGERPAPVFALLVFWSLSSLIAYPLAGEKMPWLTVHIAFPLILLAAWGFQQMMAKFDARSFAEKRGWLVLLLSLVFLVSVLGSLGSILSSNPPFKGQELYQLRATGNFLSALLIAGVSGYLLWSLAKEWKALQVRIAAGLAVSLLLVTLTIHTAVRAAFINYDSPEEYLVYAHGARGIKEALDQIEELSLRTSDGLAMEVAFDNETTYPFWWYFRDYENQHFYGENPTRDLRNSPIILVGNNNYAKLEPIVGNAYYEFTYDRIVWPNQDYYNLTWERVSNALKNPDIREGIFRIWLMRDYQKYAQATNKTISLASWNPADQMKLYVRKDVAARVWNYGTLDLQAINFKDPYEGKELVLEAKTSLSQLGLLSPRNLELASDGSLYVLDTGNNRVLHITPEGEILQTWGEYGSLDDGVAPPGSFNEPWGITVSPQGEVFVADTWNHRIQKFSADGQYLGSWGSFGQAENSYAFWGPRDVVVDELGHVYVSDTGNKRIVVFDTDGLFIAEFGEVGFGDGQFDEPAGLALDGNGNLYVADTWNQRIQVFAPDDNGIAQVFLTKWDVEGWYGQSLDNKPYLSIGPDGNTYTSDPELSRIIVFNPQGEVLAAWGSQGEDTSSLNYPTGLTLDSSGGVWVSDTKNNRIQYFGNPLLIGGE